MQKLLLSLCVMLLLCSNASAQDPIFSQPYLSPVYLNPAATGAGEYDLRVSGIYRRQWAAIPSKFTYMALSVDKFVPSLNSGIGFMATHSSEGYLTKTGIYGSYAYSICSGTISEAANGGLPKWFITGAMQFGVVQRRIDYSKLTFADQINTSGVIPGSVTGADVPVNSGKWYPDFSAGIYFNYNLSERDRFLAGLSSRHVNRPDESLTSTSDAFRSQLPVLWGGNMMYTHTNPEQTWTYSIIGLTYFQNKFNLSQVGVEVTQNDYDVSLGMWYRAGSTFKERDVFSVSLCFNITGRDNNKSKFRIGVAHDSQLSNNKYSYNAGSTEAGFVWDQSTYDNDPTNPCKPRISSRTACPTR